MKKTYKDSIEFQTVKLIEQNPHTIILRQDLSQLGSYRQISRVLNNLIQQKKIVKIGAGIYTKAYSSKYIDKPLITAGFDVVAREALNRLGVKWETGSAEQAYNANESQQIPTQNIIQLKSRFRRKLTYINRQLYFEGNVNAR